jgi:hypothetical protein
MRQEYFASRVLIISPAKAPRRGEKIKKDHHGATKDTEKGKRYFNTDGHGFSQIKKRLFLCPSVANTPLKTPLSLNPSLCAFAP